jgi:hypothetical protein
MEDNDGYNTRHIFTDEAGPSTVDRYRDQGVGSVYENRNTTTLLSAEAI